MNPANPINSNFQSVWIWSIRINPNYSEKFGFIRIDWIHSDCKFGLILINSDWLELFGLQFRIDFEWVSGLFGLKNFFGLDRTETVWFGYKFRNNS